MRFAKWGCLVFVIFGIYLTSVKVNAQDAQSQLSQDSWGQVGFVAEKGQFKTFDNLLFQWHGKKLHAFLLPDRVVFITQEVEYVKNEKSVAAQEHGDDNLAKKLSAVTRARRFDLVFVHSNPDVIATGEEVQDFTVDYYLGHCPQGILNTPSYKKIRYNNLFPDVDLVFTLEADRLKYEFQVKSGGDPSKINYRWEGVNNLHLNENKEIQFSVGSFDFTDMAPVSFCEGKEIGTKYILEGNDIRFAVSGYNQSETLVIDPALYWASSLQYNGYGSWGALVTNTAGEYYVVDWEWDPGSADVSSYLASAGSSTLYSSDVAANDIIISKFSKTGSLTWACRYGGTGDDDVNGGVALDDNNNLFIAGISSKEFSAPTGDFPLQTWAGALNMPWNGTCTGNRGYLLKFLANNTRQWATYLDNGTNLEVFDIACGLNNDIYLAGKSGGSLSCTGIPIPTGSGYLGNFTSNSASHNFILRFNSSGALSWSTWCPGTTNSTGRISDIAVDKTNGDVFLAGDDLWSAGYTFSAALISSAITYMGQDDMFYMKFNTSNNPVPAYGRYIGGAGFDKINIGAANGDIELDASGSLYVCGHTYSANFPLVNPGTCAYYDGIINDGSGISANVASTQDGYLFKVNASGALSYSTFFGGTGYTAMKQLKKDSHGNLWVCGNQTTAGLGTVSHAGYFNQAITGASSNILLAQLGANDNMEWLSYYGFAGYSEYNGFDMIEPASDSAYLYLTGNFNVTANTGGGYQYVSGASCSGAAQFRHKLSPLVTISGTTSLCSGLTTTWTGSYAGGVWTSSNTGIFTVNSSSGLVTGVAAGTATITYTVTISSCVFTATGSITITAGTTPTFAALGPYCVGGTPGALPATSTNSIAGTWSPATISTAAPGTTTYTFTPSVPCATTTTMSVTVNSPLTATITAGGPTTFCNGGSVVLTASGGSSYLWSNGATTTSISANIPGSYTARVTSGCGSPASAAIVVTVNAPAVAIITGNATICIGMNSVLSAASSIAGSGTITGYQWWYDNGTTNTAISGATGVTYTATNAGNYSVVITDSNGCTSVACP